MIEKVVHKTKLSKKKSDFKYWQSQSVEKRMEALEEIRQEYNSWRYGDQQGFQRVFKIIRPKQR